MLRWLPRPFSVGLLVFGCAAVLAAVLSRVPLSAAPAPQPLKKETADLGGGVKMEFMLIPQGKFMMGSPKGKEQGPMGYQKDPEEEKQHEVEITKPFYLAKYPVTQEQYQALIGKNPSYFRADGPGADAVKGLDTKQFPVEFVSWDEAQAFCKKLGEKDSQKRKFCLPTEAEWEYACRAGTTTPFSFGEELNGKQANCNGTMPFGTTEEGPNEGRPTKVGTYGENKWGLCDMHGNVWQWCADYYGPFKGLNAKDPLRAVKHSEDNRVLRGGSFIDIAWVCRSACRNRGTTVQPNNRSYHWGFRVAYRLD